MQTAASITQLLNSSRLPSEKPEWHYLDWLLVVLHCSRRPGLQFHRAFNSAKKPAMPPDRNGSASFARLNPPPPPASHLPTHMQLRDKPGDEADVGQN